MKLWLSPYTLKSKLGWEKPGFLLRLQRNNGTFGYSDISPWPQFGDPSVEEIPKKLKSKELPPLLKRSLWFAKKDAMAREVGVAIGDGLSIKNHKLIIDEPNSWLSAVEEAFSQGFTKVKVKLGKNPSEEIKSLQVLSEWKRDSKWLRLDFNCRGSIEYLKAIAEIEEVVEFVEDPFGLPNEWESHFALWAYDQPPFDSREVPYSHRIVKPAKLSRPKDETKPVVYTSYMDHPVGIAHGIAEAQTDQLKNEVSGFMTHTIFEETPFHELLSIKGDSLAFKPDLGVGFTYLLESLPWEEFPIE